MRKHGAIILAAVMSWTLMTVCPAAGQEELLLEDAAWTEEFVETPEAEQGDAEISVIPGAGELTDSSLISDAEAGSGDDAIADEMLGEETAEGCPAEVSSDELFEELTPEEEPEADAGSGVDEEEETQESLLAADGEVTVTDSGTCGTGLTWKLTSDGTLTISGTGAMNDYSQISGRPWSTKKITRIIIEEGVTSIGQFAFYNCENLANAVLPSTLTLIDESAFIYCRNLTAVTVSEGLQTIGAEAFYSCKNLEDFTIPSTVRTIGKKAFYECKKLKVALIPEGVTEIADHAFYYCEALTNVSLPSTLESIEEYAFWGTAMETLTIPEAVQTIGASAFYTCDSLTTLTMPGSLTFVSREAFDGCDLLADIWFDGDYLQWIDLMGSNRYRYNGAEVHCSQTADIAKTQMVLSDWSEDGNYSLTNNRGFTGETITYGEYTLVDGTDYEVTYGENAGHWGIGTITATGKGNFEGTVSADFVIRLNFKEAELGLCGASDCYRSINWNEWPYAEAGYYDDILKEYEDTHFRKTSLGERGYSDRNKVEEEYTYVYTYTGSEIRPVPCLNRDEKRPLVEGVDYTVEYYNNVNVGFATAIVHATGDYCTGSVLFKYYIRQAPNAVTVSQKNFTLNASSSKAQTVTIKASAKGGKLTYSSNNSKVKVSAAGVVTVPAKFAGTAVITVKAGDRNYKTASNTVNIKVNTITADSIKLTKKKITVTQGFKATIGWKPAFAYQHSKGVSIKWSSSRKSVATVSKKGVVTGKKPGTAKITAKLKNGKKVTCTVKVVKNSYTSCSSLSRIGTGRYGEICLTQMKTYYQGKYLVVEAGVYNNRIFRADAANLVVTVERETAKGFRKLHTKKFNRFGLGISPYGRKKIILRVPMKKKYDLVNDVDVCVDWTYYYYSY